MNCTLPGREPPDRPSPTLLLQRWHFYRWFAADEAPGNERSPKPFDRDARETLAAALERIERVNREPGTGEANRPRYAAWHTAFVTACREVAENSVLLTFRATTDWRLIVGWATNPAQETGITLHPFLGFPYAPASAIKGLLHRLLETALLEPSAESADDALAEFPGSLGPEPHPALRAALDRALLVRALFGSLAVIRAKDRAGQAFGPEAPIDRVKHWCSAVRVKVENEKLSSGPWCDLLGDLDTLCGPSTRALVTCFDAVPDEHAFAQGKRVLDMDILTPHYPTYYQEKRDAPRDDEGPVPIPFLAVAPGVTFEFRFRLEEPSTGEDDRRTALERHSAKGGKAVGDLIRDALSLGLGEWGLGAKTAAGYGYFSKVSLAEQVGAAAPPGGLVASGDASRLRPPPPDRPAAPLDPAKAAEAFLFGHTDPGTLPTRLDIEVRALPEAVQREVARIVRTRHADQVAAWRKKAAQGKKAVQARVAWLDSFAGEPGR